MQSTRRVGISILAVAVSLVLAFFSPDSYAQTADTEPPTQTPEAKIDGSAEAENNPLTSTSKSEDANGEGTSATGATNNADSDDAKRTQSSSETGKEAEEKTQDETTEKRKQIIEEATSAIRETENALKSLDENKKDDALAALERATGKLEIILVREPELALAPSNVSTVTYDVLVDTDEIKTLINEAQEALGDGRVQEARRLIRNLASETVIRITSIPLATYPGAIKLAVKLIDDGKTEEAKRVLQAALNTLVVTEKTIVPLPIAAAEELLKEAENLAEKPDRNEEENKELSDLLKKARKELQLAEALGYGSEEDFENLYGQVDEIEKKTQGGKSEVGLFAKIKGYLTDAMESSQAQ